MTKQLKRPLQWVLLCLGIMFLSSCQQSEVENSSSNGLQMSLVANIGNFNEVSNSRYVGSDPNVVEFGEYDNIGVFMDGGEAMQWTYGLTGWTSDEPVYWPDKDVQHVFHAYYPYSPASSVDDVPMPDLKEQTGTIPSISRCDFLVASTTQDFGEDGTVLFKGEGKSFAHVSSLLKLTIKGDDDLKSSVLNCITIEGTNLIAPARYSFENNSVTLSPDTGSDVLDVSLEHEMNASDATFYFIVNEKKDELSSITLTIEYTTEDKTYVAQLENFAGNVFEGGMQQSYTITIKDRTLLITGAEILPWGVGENLDDIIINGTEK